MSEDIDPESTIPWPGFVDILSTVIIVFVFFMMMTSVIIFVLSDQAKKAAVDNAVKTSKSDVKEQPPKPAPETSLAPEINNLLLEKENLLKEINKLTQIKTVLSESMQQTTAKDANVITVTYSDMGATILPETTEFIKQSLPFEGSVTITAYIPQGNDFSSIKEIALNRALNIRNVLLEGGIPSDRIMLKIIAQTPNAKDEVENQYGSVTLTFAN